MSRLNADIFWGVEVVAIIVDTVRRKKCEVRVNEIVF